MAVKSSQITLDSTATPVGGFLTQRIVASDKDGLSAVVTNAGTVAIKIGGADITNANGYELPPGISVSLDLGPREDIWALLASGSTVPVHILTTRSV